MEITLQSRLTWQLSFDTDEFSGGASDHLPLAGYAFEARRTPDFHTEDALFRALSDSTAEFRTTIEQHGYQSWLLMIGPPLTHEQKSKVKVYDLANRARKASILGRIEIVKSYKVKNAHERTVGIYNIEKGRFIEAIKYISVCPGSIVVMSKGGDEFIGERIDQVYRAAIENVPPMALAGINLESLAAYLCCKGDIVIKSWVGDLYRNLIFIASPEVMSLMVEVDVPR